MMTADLSRRFLLKGGLGVSAAAVLTSCSNTPAQEEEGTADAPVTISFLNWATSEEATKENLLKVIAAFEAANPSIKINNMPVPFDQVRQQILTKFSAKDGPDVMQMSQNVPFELADSDFLADLGDGLAEDDWAGAHFPKAIEASTINGKMVVAPWIISSFGLWYDREVMAEVGLDPDKPPTTFDEFTTQVEMASEKLGEGRYALGIDTTNVDVALFQFMNYFLAFGARPLYDGKPGFDTPEVVATLEWLQHMVEVGATPIGQQIRQLRELQANGKVMFRLDGPFVAGIYKSLNPALAEGDAFYKRFGVTTIPVGPTGDNGAVANMHQLGISSESKQQKAAWEFVKFLVDSDISINEYQLPQGVIPSLVSAAESDATREALHPEIADAYLNKILPAMQQGPYGPHYAEATPKVLEALQRVSVNSEDPAKVAADTENVLKTIFS
ncbi:MAG: sugar ABC transporter substrate-binding protein [Arachnia sp.]